MYFHSYRPHVIERKKGKKTRDVKGVGWGLGLGGKVERKGGIIIIIIGEVF